MTKPTATAPPPPPKAPRSAKSASFRRAPKTPTISSGSEPGQTFADLLLQRSVVQKRTPVDPGVGPLKEQGADDADQLKPAGAEGKDAPESERPEIASKDERRSERDELPQVAMMIISERGGGRPTVGGELPQAASPGASAAARCAQFETMSRKVLRNLQVERLGSNTTLKVGLNGPKGQTLDLELRLEGGKVRAAFSAADVGGFRMVDQARSELREALSKNGVDVGAITVDLNDAHSNRDTPKRTPQVESEPEPPASAKVRAQNAGNCRKPGPGASATNYVV